MIESSERTMHYKTFVDDEWNMGSLRSWEKRNRHLEELDKYLHDVKYDIISECPECNRIVVVFHYIV